MTLHSGTEMTCADFDTSFNAYVDDMLEPAEAARCRRHIAKCSSCDREVTRWQQTRILLSTAVADFATAVDLSSVRSGVEAALGFTGDIVSSRQDDERTGGRRQAAFDRGESARPSAVRRRAQRGVSAGRRTALAGAFRFASAAAVSASVAAAAVLLLTPQPNNSRTIAASVASAPSRTSYEPAAFRFGGKRFNNNVDVAPAAYTPPPLARPETPHVDGLEAAPGHLVSTWVQPRTNARVIWVQDRGLGAPIRTAGLDR